MNSQLLDELINRRQLGIFYRDLERKGDKVAVCFLPDSTENRVLFGFSLFLSAEEPESYQRWSKKQARREALQHLLNDPFVLDLPVEITSVSRSDIRELLFSEVSSFCQKHFQDVYEHCGRNFGVVSVCKHDTDEWYNVKAILLLLMLAVCTSLFTSVISAVQPPKF